MDSREDIAARLSDGFAEVAAWYEALPDEKFEVGPDGKWSAGETLDHLIRSSQPLNKALRLPKIGPRILFGTSKSPSRDYDGVVNVYLDKLKKGGKASGQFVPKGGSAADKQKMIAAYLHEGTRLAEVTRSWSESDLDKYVLPHPLIGKMTVREMLLFTIYHTGHHLKTLKADYA